MTPWRTLPRHALRLLSRILALCFAMFFIAAQAQPVRPAPSFAFYYGTDIPWEALGAFDVAVVEPGNVGSAGWGHRLNPGTTVAAYISVGEVHPTRPYFAQVRPEWRLGENTAWGSIVVDQAAPGWSAFYVQQVVKPLWDRGFRAFFLDTLDSFNLVARTPEARERQAAGLAAVLREIKRAYPDARLIFNRGFEVLPQVHTLAWAVAAESLFQGWDAGKQEYRAVPQADRDWLLAQLLKCRDDYKLPVIAIDYVPSRERALARETAQRIRALGIVPWVTNPELDMIGVGQVEMLPRVVLAIHDEAGNVSDLSSHEIHRLGTMPLNYLGLDTRYVHVNAPEMARLAKRPLAGRYAGVLTWFNRGSFQETPELMAVLTHAHDEGVPVVMVGELPGDAAMEPFGKDVGETVRLTRPVTLEKRSPHVGFEIQPQPNVVSFTPSTLRPGAGEVWLRVHAEGVGDADVIAITRWGGYAADQYWKVELPQDNGNRWVVNPIEFFRAAFKVPPDRPVPDVTTETGRRLLLVHVDGDAFVSRAEIPGTPFASEVMLKEFLERYRWPSAISIIEGETSPRGIYPAQSAAAEAIARRIFALPHVEVASHTYSHPFYWADFELGRKRPDGAALSLNIPGYRYDAAREITGARDYIDRLAPPGKKTRIVLWSGDTQPLETPVRLAYEAGLLNMNSGNTWITKAEPSLSVVGPLGMLKGGYFQVYAPNQNENNYTNLWNGPFYGFERVVETFEMTERPLRLKPVNIYYHTYIMTKRAGISSLHKVYGWAQDQLARQRLHPVYPTEYAERVLDWRRATVARAADGSLELRGGRHLREWRVDAAAALPAASASDGIAGFVRHDSGAAYVHAARPVARYAPAVAAASGAAGFYLESANAKLLSWDSEAGRQTLRFDGHLPLAATLVAPGCELQPAPGQRATRRGDRLDVEASTVGPSSVVLRCPG